MRKSIDFNHFSDKLTSEEVSKLKFSNIIYLRWWNVDSRLRIKQ